MNKTTKILLIIAAILIIIGMATCYFKRHSNQIIDKNVKLTDQKTEHIITDKGNGVSQDVLVTNDPELIKYLTDSLQSDILKKAGINKPVTLIQWKDRYIETNANGTLDSLSKEIDKLLAKKRDTSVTQEQLDQIKKELLSKKFNYTIDTKYRKEKGWVDLNGIIHSDTLTIFSSPSVIIGEKTGLFKRPKLSIAVTNSNPLIHSDSAQSIVYIPEDRISLSAGPIFLFNNKGNTTIGAGINVKYKWFSVSLGYTPNK